MYFIHWYWLNYEKCVFHIRMEFSANSNFFFSYQRDSSPQIFVIIYSSSCFSKPVWFFFFCWKWDDKIRCSLLNGSQWLPATVWLQTFFKISSFLFNEGKKLIQVWNNLRVNKWWERIFIFGWTIPLNVLLFAVIAVTVFKMQYILLHIVFFIH